jgi:putative Holliday junction resolvase
MTQYLAVDFGDRRVGVATGNDETRLAQPLETLLRSDTDERDAALFKRLRELVHEWRVRVVVVGDPVNMDGSRGPRSEISHAFAKKLGKSLRQVEVLLWDERLSSFTADEWMERDGVKASKKKEKRDAYAAAAILKSHFDESSTPGPGQRPPAPG